MTADLLAIACRHIETVLSRRGGSMTYSILVRAKETRVLGAAAASRFFAVGAMCIYVEGSVAALATQALVNPMYAVRAMPRLRGGEAPDTIMGIWYCPTLAACNVSSTSSTRKAASPSTPGQTASPGLAT